MQVDRQIEFDEDLVVDRGKLGRALLNIVRNAGEAMPREGRLVLRIDLRGAAVVFTISDTGGGIPEHLLPSIYEPFVTHGKSGGTGLVMATTKSIVDAHGGRIDVQSVTGKGTTFIVSIPRAGPERYSWTSMLSLAHKQSCGDPLLRPHTGSAPKRTREKFGAIHWSCPLRARLIYAHGSSAAVTRGSNGG